MIQARPGPALEARELAVALAPGRSTLAGINLRVEGGQLALVVGPSGSGKTTLLRALRGLVPLSAGTLEVLGRRMENESGFVLPSDVAFIPQHLGLVRARSVLTNVLAGSLSRLPGWRTWTGIVPREEIEHAFDLLERLDIAHLADRPVLAISGGERQRTAIARAWMQHPRLVLADEFLSHLDAATAEVVLAEVEASRQQGIAYVATTHQPEIIRAHKGPLFSLSEGRPAA